MQKERKSNSAHEKTNDKAGKYLQNIWQSKSVVSKKHEQGMPQITHKTKTKMVRNGPLFSYKNAPKGSILPWAVIYNFFLIIMMKSMLCRMFYL